MAAPPMDNGSGVTEPRQVSRSIVDWLWRIAIVVTLLSQLAAEGFRTAWGRERFAATLSRAGTINARQRAALSGSLDPNSEDALFALATQIQQTVPPGSPLVVVLSTYDLNDFENHLAYLLYPRTVTRKLWPPPPPEPGQCTVYWFSATKIRLACPGSTWNYQPPPTQP